MKGLEISVLKRSEVLASSPTFRIDNQFFQKEFLVCYLGSSVIAVGDVCTVRSGTTPPDRDDSLKSGVILLKTNNIRNIVLHSFGAEDEFYYISADLSAEMADTVLQPHDVLINIVGATTDVIGRVAYVPEGFPQANITQAMALLRVRDKRIRPECLFSFLAGRYGQQQVRRIARPTGQYNMNLPEVRSLKVPILGSDVQSRIQTFVTEAHVAVSCARETTKHAERTLLRALGLEDWQPPEPLTYTRRASDVFAVGRFDAEHFQPRYRALFEKLDRNAKRCRRVEEFAVHCDRGEQPQYFDDGPLAVITSKHILETGLDYDNFDRTKANYWDNPDFESARIRMKDILTYTTGAKVGRTACYLAEDRALASNHVNLVRVEGENPLYVAAVMNSMIGRMQTRMFVSGSAQVELYSSDIRRFLIPFVDEKTETAISEAVQESYIARKRAHALLERAKRAVEIAIEESEKDALAFLSQP